MIVDDDVDMESLQAQIDMSMSFAHNLVTSWIKPTRLAQFRSSDVNAIQVLEEELRRPPRLGVGVSVPTATPLAHEASKLKRRLGKSGGKNERTIELEPQYCSKSDDEEHKGRPIKQNAKADPFEQENKKKMKIAPEANRHPSTKNSVSLLKDPTLGDHKEHDSSIKRKLHIGTDDQQTHSAEGQRYSVETVCPLREFAPSVPPPSETFQEVSAPAPGGKHKTSSRMHTNSMTAPNMANPLGLPLLNLDGPPEPTLTPGNTNELNNSKKRRKRRKKKALMTTGTGDRFR